MVGSRSRVLVTIVLGVALVGGLFWGLGAFADDWVESIGLEVAIARHLQDGEEFEMPTAELLAHGQRLFEARWTVQEGGGRPLTKGTGAPLANPQEPLTFPRNFNRISGPDANSCAGCHNQPFGVPGGSGDVVANAFVFGQRFDHVDFNPASTRPTVGSRDEAGRPVTLQNVGNSRATTGLFGAGYLEALARQITAELQAIRDSIPAGGSRELISKGISFGVLRRIEDGRFDTTRVKGMPPASLATWGADDPPTLYVRPFHQSAGATSLREFTNLALNHHHGIQSSERFGEDLDPDGDGYKQEVTRADVTALVLYQAALAPPGRVIPRHRAVEEAVLAGESLFREIGCGTCHVPELPLDDDGHLFVEPGPYNPDDHLQEGDAPPIRVDLNSNDLPSPRLQAAGGVTWVPAFTDFKLHDIASDPNDPNREPLDITQPAGLMGFFEGNGRFLTKRLWGVGNQPPYFHHGKFTTLREAILAHGGEAAASRAEFRALEDRQRDAVVEFLKTLQVLPPGSRHLIVDERGRPRSWPPSWAEPELTRTASVERP